MNIQRMKKMAGIEITEAVEAEFVEKVAAQIATRVASQLDGGIHAEGSKARAEKLTSAAMAAIQKRVRWHIENQMLRK